MKTKLEIFLGRIDNPLNQNPYFVRIRLNGEDYIKYFKESFLNKNQFEMTDEIVDWINCFLILEVLNGVTDMFNLSNPFKDDPHDHLVDTHKNSEETKAQRKPAKLHHCISTETGTVCMENENQLWVKEYCINTNKEGRTYPVQFCPICGEKLVR